MNMKKCICGIAVAAWCLLGFSGCPTEDVPRAKVSKAPVLTFSAGTLDGQINYSWTKGSFTSGGGGGAPVNYFF